MFEMSRNKSQKVTPIFIKQDMENCKIREGFLNKRSKYMKQWRDRWVVLTFNYLITFTDKSCQFYTQIHQLSQITCYRSKLSYDGDVSHAAFQINTKRNGSLNFMASTIQQKWSWIVTIQRLFDYKLIGTSSYNSSGQIIKKGFKSVEEFLNMEIEQQFQQQKLQQTMKLIRQTFDASDLKNIMIQEKELLIEKQKIQLQKLKLQTQKENLKDFLSMASQTFQILDKSEVSSEAEQQIPHLQEAILQKSRHNIINSILNQYAQGGISKGKSAIYIQFLVKLANKSEYGFNESISKLLRTHQNRRNFIKSFLEIIDYSKKNFAQICNFIRFILDEVPGLLLQSQKNIIEKRLQKFLELLKKYNSPDILIVLDMIEYLNNLSKQQNTEVLSVIKEISETNPNIKCRQSAAKFIELLEQNENSLDLNF